MCKQITDACNCTLYIRLKCRNMQNTDTWRVTKTIKKIIISLENGLWISKEKISNKMAEMYILTYDFSETCF